VILNRLKEPWFETAYFIAVKVFQQLDEDLLASLRSGSCRFQILKANTENEVTISFKKKVDSDLILPMSIPMHKLFVRESFVISRCGL
jgi:hypothetical protein